MRKISSRSSLLTHFLPARTRCRESQVQYSLKPARCHRTTVSGWTRINACLHPDQNRRNMTQKSLSVTARRGWECLRFKTASCCRRAKFSKRRSRREEKNRITGTSSSFTRRSMREVVHGESQIGYWAHRHNSTADRYFGERQLRHRERGKYQHGNRQQPSEAGRVGNHLVRSMLPRAQ
jgi:hypothetical protein